MHTKTNKSNPDLQKYNWPPVQTYMGLTKQQKLFFSLNTPDQGIYLENLRSDTNKHREFVNNTLGIISSYLFGYEDSPCYLEENFQLEVDMSRAKIVLEHELLNYILAVSNVGIELTQQNIFAYLHKLAQRNAIVTHKLYDFIANEASKENILEFLFLETMRNEVVDDEVALLSVGLQGMLKNTIIANLYDECGKNNLIWFHTYWLRMFCNETDTFESIKIYRQETPWFSKISINLFNAFLTRSPYKLRGYGYFLISEGIVAPHFKKILTGLKRVGFDDRNISVYYTSHLKIDPNHTMELVEGLKNQLPVLSARELKEIYLGAISAINGIAMQYDYLLKYFVEQNTSPHIISQALKKYENLKASNVVSQCD